MSIPPQPEPEHLTLVEEHVVPALSTPAYARRGLHAALASWRVLPLRVARFVVAMPFALAVPVLLAAVLADARGFDLADWLHGTTGPVPREALVSAAPVFAVLSALFGHVLLKATLDAGLFAGLRGAVCPRRPLDASEVLRLYPGFAGLVLLDIGLLVGSILFLWPAVNVVLRVLGGVGEVPEGAALFAVLVLVPGGLLVALGRFWVSVAAAFLTWRPRFVAATLVTAVWMPVRQWRSFGPLFAAYAAGYLAVVTTAAVLIERGLFGGLSVSAGTWFVVVLVQMALATWNDTTLVGLVGQRLGDIEPAADGVRWQRPRLDQSRGVTLPPPFEPRLPGAYVVDPGSSAVVSFAEALRWPSASAKTATPAAAEATGRA